MKKSIPFLNLHPLLENESTQCLTWQDDIFFINSYELPEMCHEPFQTDFSLIFLMKKGRITGELNCRRFEAIAPCLLIVPSHMLQKVTDMLKKTEKKLLILSKNITDGMFVSRKERFFWNQVIPANPIIPLSEKQYQNHLLYFNLIENELQESGHLNPSKTIQKLFEALLSKYPANEILRNITSLPRDRKEVLLQKFHLSLHDFCRQQRAVSFYADKLSVSPQYLSKVTKEKTGKSALELIDYYVLENLKAVLRQEERSLKDIADDFSFGSFDLMNKYFKRRTGISPSEYRKRHRLPSRERSGCAPRAPQAH